MSKQKQRVKPGYPKHRQLDLPWFQARSIWSMYQCGEYNLADAYVIAGNIANTFIQMPNFDMQKFLDYATKGKAY